MCFYIKKAASLRTGSFRLDLKGCDKVFVSLYLYAAGSGEHGKIVVRPALFTIGLDEIH